MRTIIDRNMKMNVRIKRIYEKVSRDDGARVLVDRLWPRGVSKERAKLDAWLKDIAPTSELRKWFDHDPPKWAVFKRKYKAELQANAEAVEELKRIGKKRKITLLYGARDSEHNEAVVIRDLISPR